MTLNIILLVVVALLSAGIITILLRQKRDTSQDLVNQQIEMLGNQVRVSLDSSTQNLQQQFHNLQSQMSEQLKTHVGSLQNTSADMNVRLDNAARVIMDVKKELGAVKETVRAVGEIKDILKAPKLRGGLGELFLGDILSQILPAEHYALQYGFADGQKVDAIVKLGDRMVPVDSKFPLENFRKLMDCESDEEKKPVRRQLITDVKRHIDAVSKYIRADEGTYDFALMYVCAENIYYEIAIGGSLLADDRQLIEYAMQRKVFPVSPNTLYTYLYTIILGLKGMQIEKHAEAVLSRLSSLQKDFERLNTDFALVGKHLHNTQQAYDKADKRLTRMEDKLIAFVHPGDTLEALPEPSADADIVEVVDETVN